METEKIKKTSIWATIPVLTLIISILLNPPFQPLKQLGNQINSICFFLCFLCMFSCGRGTNSTPTVSNETSGTGFFVFDLENSIHLQRTDTVLLNSLIDSVRFIPLETKKESLFHNTFCRFGIIGQNMFISGGGVGSRGSAVLQFDFEGKYIGQIAQKGQGPSELPYLMTWYTHGALQQLNAVGGGTKMVIKSFKNDKTTEVKIEARGAFDIIPLNDGSFVAAGPPLAKEYKNLPYLYFIDANGKVFTSMNYPEERDIYITMQENPRGESAWPFEMHITLPRFSGDALFQDAYNDTTYLIRSAEDLRPYLVFKRGKYMPVVEDAHNVERKSKQIFIREIMETEDYIFLTTVYNKNFYFDIWSKETLQLFSRAKVGINSQYRIQGGHWTYYELPNGETRLINIQYVEKNTLYAVIDAEIASTFLEGIQEEDNPVIMVAKLKTAIKE